MELLKQSVKLSDDITAIVKEADAGYDARVAMLYRAMGKIENENKTFVFFCKIFYPLLAACTTDAPDPETAFALDRKKIDEWYLALWKLNPDILGEFKYEGKTTVVEFRDGSHFTLHEAAGLPSYEMRLHELTLRAESVASASDEDTFRNYIYPRIAACTDGDVPDVEEVIQNYPKSEIAKWAAGAMMLNNDWFQIIFDAAALQVIEQENLKKKEELSAMPSAE